MKIKRIMLPNGTYKVEVIKKELTSEEKKKRERIRLEHIKESNERIAKNSGFKNYSEYSKMTTFKCAIKAGFRNFNEYHNEKNYLSGISHPMNENKECSLYIGVYITENVLSKVFEDIKRMPNGNPGFDLICKNGFKIDVKSSCLCIDNRWMFNIKQNMIADYFLMIAYDNLINLNPLHIWLIKNTEEFRQRSSISGEYKKLNSFTSLHIANSEKILRKYKKYELTDKLDKVKEICDKFKREV